MTLAPEIRGPRGIRHAVTTYLRDRLPAHIGACRQAWELTDDELPIPVSRSDDPRVDAYFARPVDVIDRWPMLSVTNGPRTQLRSPRGSVDFEEDGSLVTMGTYPMRVYCWVRAEGRDETIDMRDDFATALQIAVHADLTLASRWLAVEPSSIRLDFSDVEKVKGERWVAGAYVGFDLAATETLTDRLTLPGQQPRDTVSGVNASGTPLPPISGLQ